MQLPHISLIAALFAYFSKVSISHIFSAQIGIFDGKFNILCVSVIYFYYVSLPRPPGCQQNGTIHVSGPLWNKMQWLVLSNPVPYSRIFLPHIWRLCSPHRLLKIFFSMLHKTDMPKWHTHTHTHPFNGHFSGTTQVSRYQKGKTNLDFTEARDSEWQWH